MAGVTTDDFVVKTIPESASLKFSEIIRIWLSSIKLKRLTLWREMQQFSLWMEFEASRITSENLQRSFRIEIGPEGEARALLYGDSRYHNYLERFPRLWSFLLSLGITALDLDSRLERDQLKDVFKLLYARRREIIHASPDAKTGKRLADLISEDGIHYSCTHTSIVDGTLSIRYSYCVLRFSRLVNRFKVANKSFRDHRALFRAAPRFAFIYGPLIFLPRILLAYSYGNGLLFIIATLEALFFIIFVYLFFRTVGSIEYDKEEQAYELSLAYGKLQSYTSQMKDDMSRAQLAQEHFLPDMASMPLPDKTRWAASYKPADELGGDYFDVQAIDDDRVALIFADVSGHGMSAALSTAIMKTTFQAWLDNPTDLMDLANTLNFTLFRLTASDQYATVFLATYDASNREFTYLNCGHSPEPYRISRNGSEPSICPLDEAGTLLLGFQHAITGSPVTQVLNQGDLIFLSSDGIIESQRDSEEFFGQERLEILLKDNRHSSPEELVASIESEAEQFSSNFRQTDDRTILALQVM